MIKNLIFTTIILFSITVDAQYNSQFNRGGRRNQQRQQPMTTPKQKPPKFNVEMAVGMTFYNIEKVTKKIGIKKDSKKFIVVSSIFKKFNADLASDLGLSPGVKRIFVVFKIDKRGNIVDVMARAPHKRLQDEAIRVVKLLPKMIPGKQRGIAVGVKYSLPIAFKVE
mgnify:CR=1 FL=1